MKKTTIPILVIFLILLSGCGIINKKGSANLDGTSWTLVSFNGRSLIPGSAMTAEFTKGEISGSASCNHYFGSYQIKNGTIQISDLGWTEMACLDPEGIMEQEQLLMAMLADSKSISFSDLMLELMTSDGTILVFEPLSSLD